MLQNIYYSYIMGKRKPNIAQAKAMMYELFSCLSPEEQAKLEKGITLRSFKKNEEIYREGKQATHIFCLLEGKVKVYKEGVGGRSQTIRLIKPVQYFGYTTYLMNRGYITSAMTLEVSHIAFVPLQTIMQIIEQNSKLALFFINKLTIALALADERTINLTQKHIRGRLAEALLFLKDCYGLEEDGSTLSIYMSREDLANLSNMTTSNAIRTLSAFAAEKLIVVDGRKIKIIKEKELEHISSMG